LRDTDAQTLDGVELGCAWRCKVNRHSGFRLEIEVCKGLRVD
jgi:hypothetical protein